MTIKQLIEILNNKKEIPSPEKAPISFYLYLQNGEEIELNLDSLSAFNVAYDICFNFKGNQKLFDIKLQNKIIDFISACRYAGEGGLEKLRQDACELLREINDNNTKSAMEQWWNDQD